MIEANMPFISVKLSDYLKHKYNSQKYNLKWAESKDKYLIPEYNGKILHSKYYTEKESDKYLSDNFESQKIAVGIGACYHLTKISENRKIIAIADDPDLTLKILENVELSKYFKKDSLIICFADEIDKYFDYIKYNSFELIINHAVSDILNLNFDNIIQYLKSIISNKIVNYNTQREFAKKWLRNSIINLAGLNKSNKDNLKINKKAILICGAGPSLEENISEIKNNSKYLYIASSDTALNILLSNNIKPDSVFSMDSSYYTKYHFINSDDDIRIFMDYTSSPDEELKNVTFLFSDYPILNELKFRFLPYLNTGYGNIGASTADFFIRNTKDIPIITSGIDYGFYKKRMYSKGSFLDYYKISNSDYFNTENNIDINIFYSKKISSKENSWESNSLTRQYSDCSIKNIYTISDSPFTDSIKIDNLTSFLAGKTTKNVTISFNYTEIKDFNLNNYFNRISDETLEELLFSYILREKRNNISSEIRDRIKKLLSE